MSTVYIGRQSYYHGKKLYEIARNLKNFGVGRMVVRYTFQRYPEPTYYILTKVVPDMTCQVAILAFFKYENRVILNASTAQT